MTTFIFNEVFIGTEEKIFKLSHNLISAFLMNFIIKIQIQ